MKHNGRHCQKRKAFPFTGLILLTSVILVLGISVTVAKYVTNQKSPYQAVDAAKYYFTSDYLTVGEGTQYTIPVHDGTTGKIFFSLRNWDGMEEKYSPRGFDYTISITRDGVEVADANITGKAAFGTSAGSHEIWIEDLQVGTYIVTVSANAPYDIPVLKGTFDLIRVAHEPATLEVVDDGHVVHVTVYSNDDSGTLTITYPGTVVPDPTDSRLSGASFTAVAHSKYTFTFFKTSGTDPVIAGFNITK